MVKTASIAQHSGDAKQVERVEEISGSFSPVASGGGISGVLTKGVPAPFSYELSRTTAEGTTYYVNAYDGGINGFKTGTLEDTSTFLSRRNFLPRLQPRKLEGADLLRTARLPTI